jgi:hypothetical protein
MSDAFSHAQAVARRIEPRAVEFKLDLTYPLFIYGAHVADLEVVADFQCPADEPRAWSLDCFSFVDLDDKMCHLTGKALQDAEQVLIKHHDSYITEQAHTAVQEAA